MSTSSVSSTSSGFFSTSTTSSSANSSLDYSDFLELLTTELKYQDPSDPVSSTEYVNQMAQLGSLSALNNLYAATTNSAAFSLVGKEVAYTVTDSSGNSSTYTGTVDSVISSGGTTYLNIGGSAVALSSVVEVGDIADSSTSSSST